MRLLIITLGCLTGLSASLHAGNPPGTVPSKPLARLMQFNPHLDPADPSQLPMKLRAILQNEYKFFRGTADFFYEWCRDNISDWLAADAPRVRLHGDVHIGNLGTYQSAGPLGKDVRFGLVDLDEAFDGPFQLDLLRAVVSARFLASANGVAMSAAEWDRAVADCVAAYARAFAAGPGAEVDADRRMVVRELLDEVRGACPRQYAARFCRHDEPPRFRHCRIKNDRPSDLLEPVAPAERERIVAALGECLLSADAIVGPRRIRCPDETSLRASILDVARWTRIDSGGSQGVYKYLVLVDRPFRDAEGPMIFQLKQQPPAAAARAGLVPPSSPIDRARQVAASYERLLPWPKAFVCAAEVDGRGYVVSLKDPWGEEPTEKDFDSAAGVHDALSLMGQVLGAAHRAALRRLPDESRRAERMTASLEGLASPLAARGEAAAVYLRRLYETMAADPVAHGLVRDADAFIQRHAPPPRPPAPPPASPTGDCPRPAPPVPGPPPARPPRG